ncbi:mCG147245 [Mus musculus]|nr:mCG147245 [Mus musculus]
MYSRFRFIQSGLKLMITSASASSPGIRGMHHHAWPLWDGIWSYSRSIFSFLKESPPLFFIAALTHTHTHTHTHAHAHAHAHTPLFSTSAPALDAFSLSDNHSPWGKVISHCVSGLYFPGD